MAKDPALEWTEEGRTSHGVGTYMGVSCKGALTDACLIAWASKGNIVWAGMHYGEKWRVGGLEGHILAVYLIHQPPVQLSMKKQ